MSVNSMIDLWREFAVPLDPFSLARMGLNDTNSCKRMTLAYPPASSSHSLDLSISHAVETILAVIASLYPS